MTNLLSVFATFAVLIIFPVFIFFLFIRAVRNPGTRWWGIVILLSILTFYCTTVIAILGLIVGGNSTGTVAMERHCCEEFREVLAQTETLPDAVARMDAATDSDAYRVLEPDKNLRFRYVWLLGGCFLFAGANLMMFAPGRREKRHPADCIVMSVAALVVFLTGIWQIAWGNGYAFQASAYRRMLTEWHMGIHLDAIQASNAEIAAKLADDGVKSLYGLRHFFLDLSGEKVPGAEVKTEKPDTAAPADAKTEKPDTAAPVDVKSEKPDPAAPEAEAKTGPGIAIIGGADGPTAVFVSSELLKRQGGALSGSLEETDSSAEKETPAEPPATEENGAS